MERMKVSFDNSGGYRCPYCDSLLHKSRDGLCYCGQALEARAIATRTLTAAKANVGDVTMEKVEAGSESETESELETGISEELVDKLADAHRTAELEEKAKIAEEADRLAREKYGPKQRLYYVTCLLSKYEVSSTSTTTTNSAVMSEVWASSVDEAIGIAVQKAFVLKRGFAVNEVLFKECEFVDMREVPSSQSS